MVARGLNFDQANEGIGETGLVRDVFAGADGLLILFLNAGEIALLVKDFTKIDERYGAPPMSLSPMKTASPARRCALSPESEMAMGRRSRGAQRIGPARFQPGNYRTVPRGSYLYQFGFCGRFSSGLDSFGGG